MTRISDTQIINNINNLGIFNSMSRKVIGGYINALEHQSKEDSVLILSITLEEAIFDNITHRAIVRAINKLKASGAEICDLNVMAFLERHGIPRNIEEGNEILSVMSEYAITPKTIQAYIKQLRLNRASKVAV